MVKYNEDLALWQTCSNCTYCNKGAYKLGQAMKENNPHGKARSKWYCEGWEQACSEHAQNPDSECCEHWEIY